MRFENTTEDAQNACFGVELFRDPRKMGNCSSPVVKIEREHIGVQVGIPCPDINARDSSAKKLNRLSFC
ncbi:Dihydroorotate dehydrogenase (plasmid) [Mesorhizobium loti]|nr:Dihydroorotate dehydrogenase [Mesorhizobium loti]